jgi:myosin heavy subunit
MHLPFLIFQATDTRDALAKSVYASLFEWLVEQINKSLSVGKRRTGRSISILDIYGFESFDVMYLSFLPKVVIY